MKKGSPLSSARLGAGARQKKADKSVATPVLLPKQAQILPRAERVAAGKELRNHCLRKSHAGWQPPTGRTDPVDTLIASAEGRVKELAPIRYGRMMASPFAFYRGAAAIMAGDLALTPVTGANVQICGDCHLMNFGGFATPERQLVFDINDFDETSVGPWEWDIKRLAASFFIAAQANGFSKDAAREAAWDATDSYRTALIAFGDMPVLDAWYEHLDLQDVVDRMVDPAMQKFATSRIAKATKKTANTKEFVKLAVAGGSPPRIRDEPPLIYHDDTSDMAMSRKDISRVFDEYRLSLSPEKNILLDRFQLVDTAVKVVGVGSVGTYCGIALFISGTGDSLFLQFKEARASVIERYLGPSVYRSSGQRVVNGQRLMQASSDLFLGWMEGKNRHFYVRQLRDAKISPDLTVMKPLNLRNYAKLCGKALARAHARSGDALMLGSYLGKSKAFPDALVDFASDYAMQNERDHEALVNAVRKGKVEAQTLD